MKDNLSMWLLPVGIVLGVMLGEVIHNVPLGVAIGAIAVSVLSVVIRIIKEKKNGNGDDNRNM